MNQTKQNKIQTKKSAIPSLSVFALIHYNFLAIYAVATLRYAIIIILPCSIFESSLFSSIFLFHFIPFISPHSTDFNLYTHTIRTPFQLSGCLFAAQQMRYTRRKMGSVDIPLDGFAIAHQRAFMCNVHGIERHYLYTRPQYRDHLPFMQEKRRKKLHINCRKRNTSTRAKNRAIKMRRILKCNTDFFNFII